MARKLARRLAEMTAAAKPPLPGFMPSAPRRVGCVVSWSAAACRCVRNRWDRACRSWNADVGCCVVNPVDDRVTGLLTGVEVIVVQ
jgi:hypothetical protein